jgi:hypothetical protein
MGRPSFARGIGAMALVLALVGSQLASVDARAAGPFVDAPLTLPPLHVSADAGLGFGTYQTYTLDPNNPNAPPVLQGGTQVGWGTSLEGALGLPVIGELGLRIGYRFDGGGIAAGSGVGADHFARLFDPITTEPVAQNFANPEVRLRGALFDLKTVQLGLETRFIIPTADGSVFALTPGVPLRIHLPGLLRVDTGLYLPIAFFQSTSYSLDVPVQAFFQVGALFGGPVTGIRYNVPGGGFASSVDVPLGLAAGYTLGGVVDLKVQVRTERINDSNSASQYLGGGLGVGLRLP